MHCNEALNVRSGKNAMTYFLKSTYGYEVSKGLVMAIKCYFISSSPDMTEFPQLPSQYIAPEDTFLSTLCF